MKPIFNKQDFLEDLSKLIAINSINGNCGPTSEKAPLGEGVNNAIEAFLKVGKRFGFRTKNLDGYCGWIEMGEGDKMLGIIVHTDTVDTGDGWSYPALECTVKEDGIYGRGVIDNKGPALLALYCMKAVEESGAKLNKRVRLIIGGDEEAGSWKCMERYKKTEELPEIAFSPDAEYPVVFGEKGLLRVKIFGDEKNITPDFSFNGGKVINVVPDEATAFIDGKALSAKGKSAHGSTPEKGDNAVIKLGKEIAALYPESSFAKLMELTSAESLGINIADEVTTISVNPSVLVADSGKCSLSYDIRYPITANGEEVISNIKKAAEKKGFTADIFFHETPLYVPRDSHLVKTLSEIYTSHTGDKSESVAIGGGTYAKAFRNCVAFGVMLPDDPETMHAPDEFWSHRSIEINFDIITDAIIKL